MRKLLFFSVAWAAESCLLGGQLEQLEHPHHAKDPELSQEDQACNPTKGQFDVGRQDCQQVNDPPE